jgi:FkbM family methyltransferase
MGTSLNFAAFRYDVITCLRSPFGPFQRAKALAVLLLERWNEHVPFRWQPKVRFSIVYHGRPLQVALSLASQDYCAFREIFVRGIYEQPLGNPETILDLGANCGCATLLFAARYPNARITAVEPHPGNLYALRENLDLNHLQAQVIPAAATVTDGPVLLAVRTSLSHSLLPGEGSAVETQLTVPGISIPTLLSQLGWDRIDLLKVDIEGYERVLFSGRPAWLNKVNCIIGEHHDSYQIPELQADLEPVGFTVTPLPHRNMFLAVRRIANRCTAGCRS